MSETEPLFPEPPPPAPDAPKRLPWWLYAIALVLVAGVGVGIWVLVRGDKSDERSAVEVQRDECTRTVTLHFKKDQTDERMRKGAERLRGDSRFESLTTETQQEAYDRFQRIFASQPELLELTRKESLPAIVHLMARKGSTGEQVAPALRQEFADDADVITQEYCHMIGLPTEGVQLPAPTS
nr:permease-like cell division protein FtsX [Kibdelosporangium sp. MJ126-NF4]CEL20172.1 Cell division protein FtsX [Kibdelosporangium sp. MJ126-NF4]CTQ97397.1 Cell division protein FtsX [Kibdelosporangium sp. MJ126-NF4]